MNMIGKHIECVNCPTTMSRHFAQSCFDASATLFIQNNRRSSQQTPPITFQIFIRTEQRFANLIMVAVNRAALIAV